MTRRLIVGISGASGVIYGVKLLELLKTTDVETHLVMTKSAEITLAYEMDMKVSKVKALASKFYGPDDIAAAISSGSFKTEGMVVAPCSIRSLSEIAYGQTTSLLTRAADVALKERRRVILLLRETPLHLGHIKSMAAATEAGAIVMPPVPAFYARPKNIDEMVEHTIGRALDLFGIETGSVRRWGEDVGKGAG
jgi:4-hydroxy-3-polyprenylbenzoate decarboxylase